MNDSKFLTGVVEGFYGRPWNARQRHQLFVWMKQWRLNTYLYAPKDDLKHRLCWRELYGEMEATELCALIRDCQRHGIEFIYALGPGLDLNTAAPGEFDHFRRRLAQLVELGCRSVALLFDDLPALEAMAGADPWRRLAAVHARVANEAVEWLRQQGASGTMLFCPTPYCDRMASQAPGYLDEIGAALRPDIEVFWTGPEIVSEKIDADSARAVAALLRRKPVLWDNLHANDYDFRRAFLGPYSGRPPELRSEIRGVLTNPNCQFELNFVPIRTLALYVTAAGDWSPEPALARARDEWRVQFGVAAGPVVESQDLEWLTDIFHLPHSFGPRAEQFLRGAAVLVRGLDRTEVSTAERFERDCAVLGALYEKLLRLNNRELLYALYPLLWEMKEELALIRNYARTDESSRSGFTSAEHAPRTYRGGFVASLQRLLCMDEQGQFHAVGGDR